MAKLSTTFFVLLLPCNGVAFLLPRGGRFAVPPLNETAAPWMSIADFHIDPGCSSDEMRQSLGIKSSGEECRQALVASTGDINYGVWRGDEDQECQACLISNSRDVYDYVDLVGAVSFVKEATCEASCAAHEATWETKCVWENRVCSGCRECPTCTSSSCPRCESYCVSDFNSWERKCSWTSEDCRGCTACDSVVQVGDYTLRNERSGMYLGLSDGGEPEQWRMRLLMGSGHYTLQSMIDGRFLAAHGDSANKSSLPFLDGDLRASSAQWHSEPVDDDDQSTVTLNNVQSGMYLTVAGNSTIRASNLMLSPHLVEDSSSWVMRAAEEEESEEFPSTEDLVDVTDTQEEEESEDLPSAEDLMDATDAQEAIVQRVTSCSEKLIPEYHDLAADPDFPQIRGPGFILHRSAHLFRQDQVSLQTCSQICFSLASCAFFQYGSNTCWGFRCGTLAHGCKARNAALGKCYGFQPHQSYMLYAFD